MSKISLSRLQPGIFGGVLVVLKSNTPGRALAAVDRHLKLANISVDLEIEVTRPWVTLLTFITKRRKLSASLSIRFAHVTIKMYV